MMRQEINLLKKINQPKPTTALLSWRQFWLGNLAFFILMIITYLFMQVNLYFQHLNEKSLIKKNYVLQQEFFTIKQNYPDLFFSQNVAKTVDDLQKELAANEAFLSKISSELPISSYLSIFSETILPDIWLTNIKISEGGQQILLKGNSITTSSVQHFLEILVNEKKLSDYILSVNNIESSAPENKFIQFEILMTKKQS